MQYRVDSLGLSGGVTQVLRDLIHQRLGLFYDATHFDQLADRLAPLVVARGFGSFMDYYYFLKYSEEREEWTKVMDALAVHETYFWREIDQLRAIVDVVVPNLARRGASSLAAPVLRRWAAWGGVVSFWLIEATVTVSGIQYSRLHATAILVRWKSGVRLVEGSADPIFRGLRPVSPSGG